ncbi:MAG: hypothetical protein KDA88_15580 [Planctomycetaceae bacterium]|nr:hypothetical protein [Planctomycetaceae bacterium]
MSIARAEELKRSLTDKYVVVHDDVAELKRFAGLTGLVKTVNMSCRALVQFDGPVDIGWYDIDPTYLKVVDKPLPKSKAPEHAEAPAKKPAAAKPAATGGKSPLELARQQGASGAAPVGEKKLSPLEMARQQGAAKAAPPAAGEKKLSPLEMARQQGAKKSGDEPAAVPKPAPTVAPKSTADILAAARAQAGAKSEAPATPAPAAEQSAPAAEAEQPAEVAAKPAERVATPGTTAEIIALARQQGPFKG